MFLHMVRLWSLGVLGRVSVRRWLTVSGQLTSSVPAGLRSIHNNSSRVMEYPLRSLERAESAQITKTEGCWRKTGREDCRHGVFGGVGGTQVGGVLRRAGESSKKVEKVCPEPLTTCGSLGRVWAWNTRTPSKQTTAGKTKNARSGFTWAATCTFRGMRMISGIGTGRLQGLPAILSDHSAREMRRRMIPLIG